MKKPLPLAMGTGGVSPLAVFVKAPAIWNKSALCGGSIAAARYDVGVPYRITPHAAARLAERGVPGDWLAQVLQSPQCVVPAAYGREERQGLFERGGKTVLLRVICEGDLVITALLTSKLGKFGGQN